MRQVPEWRWAPLVLGPHCQACFAQPVVQQQGWGQPPCCVPVLPQWLPPAAACCAPSGELTGAHPQLLLLLLALLLWRAGHLPAGC